MKKILILSVFPAPYRIAVFKGISKKYDTTICFEKNSNEERAADWFEKSGDNINFLMLDNSEGMEQFLKEIKEVEKYDLVICYDPFTYSARKLQRYCIRKKVKYIINADGALDIKRFNLRALVKRYYVRNATLCFAGCQKARNYFKAYGADEQKIRVHNFTSLYKEEILLEPLSNKDKSVLRAKYNVDNKMTFLAIGQFIHRKGFDILLNAWEQDDFSQLFIIGGGSKKREYMKIIDERKLNNVTLYDFMEHEKLKDFYKLSDIFVMPTREDIWGLVVNEAMSFGLPVISSDRCNAGLELIQNSINGYLYPANEIQKLKDIISWFKNNSKLLPVYSSAALKSVDMHYYENIINSHLVNINDILKK